MTADALSRHSTGEKAKDELIEFWTTNKNFPMTAELLNTEKYSTEKHNCIDKNCDTDTLFCRKQQRGCPI